MAQAPQGSPGEVAPLAKILKKLTEKGYSGPISVELFLPGVSKPVKLLGEVRWCTASDGGGFQAGLRLRRRLTYAELTGLTG